MFTVKSNLLLKIILTTFPLIFISNLHAQSFCESYRKEIIKRLLQRSENALGLDRNQMTSINKNISDLGKTLKEFEKKHGYSILRNDTVFMIGLDAPIYYNIIWNGKESCYYKKHTVRINATTSKADFITKRFEVHSDASILLDEFSEDCKRWILTADTDNFSNHAQEEKILQYRWLTFTRAIKKNGKWKFLVAGSYYITDDTLTPEEENQIKKDEEERKYKKT